VVIAIIAVVAISAMLAFVHSPPAKTSAAAWATQAALIASGGLGFALVCLVEGVIMQAIPQVAFALATTLLPVFIYSRTRKPSMLALASALWILVGWWATVGSTF
jgi:hypothetical protein